MIRIPPVICLLITGLATAGLASAQPPPGQFRALWGEAPGGQAMLTCWYNESGQLTGSEPAEPGTAVGSKSQADSSGDHTWSYVVQGHNSAACPAKLPVGTIVR